MAPSGARPATGLRATGPSAGRRRSAGWSRLLRRRRGDARPDQLRRVRSADAELEVRDARCGDRAEGLEIGASVSQALEWPARHRRGGSGRRRITSCRPSGATSSPSSAATTKPHRRLPEPPRRRAVSRSKTCCSIVLAPKAAQARSRSHVPYQTFIVPGPVIDPPRRVTGRCRCWRRSQPLAC